MTSQEELETEAFKQENTRMENYLAEFTSRQGVLLTIAGLMTLLPLSAKTQIDYFFVWCFPFLFLAVASYVLSARRINFVSKRDPQIMAESFVNKSLKSVYFNSLKFHRLADSLIVAFFVSFFLNYLSLVTSSKVLFISCVILCVSILFGIIRYASLKEMDTDFQIGVGGGS